MRLEQGCRAVTRACRIEAFSLHHCLGMNTDSTTVSAFPERKKQMGNEKGGRLHTIQMPRASNCVDTISRVIEFRRLTYGWLMTRCELSASRLQAHSNPYPVLNVWRTVETKKRSTYVVRVEPHAWKTWNLRLINGML
jgi:hypothetical protein